MAEHTAIDDQRAIVERIQAKAKEEKISIDEAAKRLKIPVSRYYRFQARIKKAGVSAQVRTTRPYKKRDSQKDKPASNGVHVRELRDQIAELSLENAQLRAELLQVLLENRRMRLAQEQ